MATNWNDLKHKASQEVRDSLKREAHAELARIGFDKLRQARQQTQTAVAKRLHVGQGAVSRIERQSDFLLSTVREFVAALGGHLELHAIFPDGDFVIDPLNRAPARKWSSRTRSMAVRTTKVAARATRAAR